MHKSQQMSGNWPRFEGSAQVDIEPIAHIDHLPSLCLFTSRSACDLKSDQRQAHPRQQSVQMRLNGADETAIVPIHQATLPNGLNKSH